MSNYKNDYQWSQIVETLNKTVSRRDFIITSVAAGVMTMGLTILFAEQNIKFATEIADRAYVIEGGEVRYEGTITQLEKQSDIKEKYLMI